MPESKTFSLKNKSITDSLHQFPLEKGKSERSLHSESSISDTRSTDSNETGQVTIKRQNSDGSTKFSDKSVMRNSLSFICDINGATSYRGITFEAACRTGNLPAVVLLWSMATAKAVNLMVLDCRGNNPMHYAACANTVEVMAFIYQQTKGRLNGDTRLVDTRNESGETPLLSAMDIGNVLVIRALLDEGSDVFAKDKYGNTVFLLLAKKKHIWTVHYLYVYICDKFGIDKAVNFLNSKDVEGHNVLDRAASVGDMNLLEYFIRKGLDPSNHVDFEIRSPLYWAVKNNQVNATRFLVLLGCNPFQVDSSGFSPRSIASQQILRCPHLYNATNATLDLYDECSAIRTLIKSIYECSRFSKKKDNSELDDKIVLNGGVNCYIVTNPHDNIRSLTILRTNKFSLMKTFVFTGLVLGLWITSIILPFYYWFTLIVLVIILYKYAIKSFLTKTPEKYVGFYLGNFCVMLFFWICNIYVRFSVGKESINPDINAIIFNDIADAHKYAYLPRYQIGALSGSTHDESLLWLFGCCLFASLYLLLTFVVFKRDEGMIDTRLTDFDNILHHSIECNGQPSTRLFCTTTFVAKPLRSKYCSRTGYTIARYDHFCKWLNVAIGYYNHRRFVLFIFIHLLTTVSGAAFVMRAMVDEITFGHRMTRDDSCALVSTILRGRYFSAFILLVIFLVLSLFFFVLLIEQVSNICRNMTTNEIINESRYPWMQRSNGVLNSRFDRGVIGNTCEFFGFFSYGIDYTRQFEMPKGDSRVFKVDENDSRERNVDITKKNSYHPIDKVESSNIEMSDNPNLATQI